jgi:hypothetical protein
LPGGRAFIVVVSHLPLADHVHYLDAREDNARTASASKAVSRSANASARN